MKQQIIDTQIQCFHCGEDCNTKSVVIQEKHFCCDGCKTVYQILNQISLSLSLFDSMKWRFHFTLYNKPKHILLLHYIIIGVPLNLMTINLRTMEDMNLKHRLLYIIIKYK